MKEKGIKVNGADMAVFFAHQTLDDRKKHFCLLKMFTATFFLQFVCLFLLSYFPPYVGFWNVVVACLKMGFSPCKGKQTACW